MIGWFELPFILIIFVIIIMILIMYPGHKKQIRLNKENKYVKTVQCNSCNEWNEFEIPKTTSSNTYLNDQKCKNCECSVL
jgi:hypothetical protein